MNEREVFEAALAIGNPDERSAFLDSACADTAMREHIDGLIDAHEKLGSFLELPASDLPATAVRQPINEAIGTMIGPYKLLEQIGEGGMGVVYMAEQMEPVKRRVALKIIKPGMDSKQVLARFEAERQALAMMDHPNIAKVFHAGALGDGKPFFVMELVKGIPITNYCDQHRLTPKQRLALFVDVCQAVQHAHQKGIIHRDLKPSNVLVARFDDRPVVKVIDFGVAKAANQALTERTVFTRFNQIVGTLEYMSPEQAQLNQLDIDTRSDIYSLGVLLYELLTGQTPFDRRRLRSAAFDEVLRIIREEEPPRPSVKVRSSETASQVAENRQVEPAKLRNAIKGDLDWIVMKALEKDRARRFGSAAAFARDIQRFLNSEPIESRPPSNAYRLRKAAWRHRIGLTVFLLTAVATFMVLLGIGGARVAKRAQQETLYQLRALLFNHGITLIMNAEVDQADEIVDRLKEAGADEFALKLEVFQLLHKHDFSRAIEFLEPAVKKHRNDAGLRAMLTDAYDQAGRIHEFVQSFQILEEMNTNELRSIELIYAALAGIADPGWGYPLANRAVKENWASPYARLVRARMAANYVQRSYDPLVGELTAEQQHLLNQALSDVESLRHLYEHDERIPPLSLSTYIFVAQVKKRAGRSDWQQTLDLAEDAVSCLEGNNPIGFGRFFLAEYYQLKRTQDGSERTMASQAAAIGQLRQAAAVEDNNDYLVNFYFAHCYEYNRSPEQELLTRVDADEHLIFGKYGLGCWLALNGDETAARAQVDELIGSESASAGTVSYAIMILLLLGDEDNAAQRASEYVEEGQDHIALTRSYLKDLVEYFNETLNNSPEQQQALDADFMARTRDSDCPAEHASFAYWAIGLRHWASGNKSDALKYFDKCVQMGQIEFPHYGWAKAILQRELQ